MAIQREAQMLMANVLLLKDQLHTYFRSVPVARLRSLLVGMRDLMSCAGLPPAEVGYRTVGDCV